MAGKKHPILTVLAILGLVILFLGVTMIMILKAFAPSSDLSFGEKIGVIPLEGVISHSRSITSQLVEFKKDKKIKAIILRINSPGGSVGASQEIHQEVRRTVQTKTVVVSMGGVAASGGYYIAAPSSKIVANPGTITGSIGVLMEFVRFKELLEKIGGKLVAQLLRLDKYVDMIIPRGGAGLHRLCREQSTIPVITGGLGICHLYVDNSADLAKSINVIVNAKVQRPSVCNALDTLLVHRDVAAVFIPQVADQLAKHGVELHADEGAYTILKGQNAVKVILAGAGDFDQEWLALIMGIKIVDNLEQAITHIQDHSTFHSDGILTNNWHNATRFVNEIDSSAVFVNASTRFNDGGQFGLGAEVAISTQKLHARGPMGLEELTTYKWVVLGDMHIRP